jgi:glycosyltransferase involved in cell wall biosynthesis
MKISAVLIVKNESSCLETCLESVRGVDEIIVVDTGSTDNTVEIARKYTDKVFEDYKWNDNFAEARNHALSKATGDWILSIDADNRLLTSINTVREVIEKAEEKGYKTVNVILYSGKSQHKFPNLFKKCKEVYWIGAVHNYLSISGQMDSFIWIEYKYSKAHQQDPDRALRILLKEVEKGDARELYYLAREYYYRKNYASAIEWWEKYVLKSKFLAEQADAYLMLARCYWAVRQGEKARQNCIKALNINANFKEAILFMASISWEHNAKQWRKMAETATNERVLFIRN